MESGIKCHDDEFRSYYLNNGKCIYKTCKVEIPSVLLMGLKNHYLNTRGLFYTDKHAHFLKFFDLTVTHKLQLIDETLFNK